MDRSLRALMAVTPSLANVYVSHIRDGNEFMFSLQLKGMHFDDMRILWYTGVA